MCVCRDDDDGLFFPSYHLSLKKPFTKKLKKTRTKDSPKMASKLASNILSVFNLDDAKKRDDERNKLNEDERALRREQRARNQKKGNFTEMIRKITHAIGGYPRFAVRVDPVSIVRTTSTHTHKQTTAHAITLE